MFVVMGIGIFKLRIQCSSDTSGFFKVTWLHRKTFPFFIGWHQYSVVFFHKCPWKKKIHSCLSLMFLQSNHNSVGAKLPLCIRETFPKCNSAWIFVPVRRFAGTLLCMHAPLILDQLLPTFIRCAILKLTWFVWLWFQLCGPFGSCWWRDGQILLHAL